MGVEERGGGGGVQGIEIEAVPTAALNLPARRALNAELDCTRLAAVFGVEPRDWREPLAEAVAALAAVRTAA